MFPFRKKNRFASPVTIILFLIVLLASGTIAVDGLTDHPGAADLAVIPGNTVHEDGTVSDRLKARLDTALDLYQQGYFKTILVSGGIGREGQNEAKAMHNYLVERSIPAAAIFLDETGNNTALTALHTKALMERHGWRSVLIVTHYYHIPRCRMLFANTGIETIFTAHAIPAFAFRDLYSLPREIAAIIYYYFLHMRRHDGELMS